MTAVSGLVEPVVLVVDDDPAVRDALDTLLARRLEPLFRVETASSAEEALGMVAGDAGAPVRPVALVISDEKMPGRSGTDLMIALRQHPAHRGGGRILITAYAGLASAKRAINDAEVDRYFPKPWDAERSLLPAVAQALTRFARDQGLDRFLMAAPVTSTEAMESVRLVREAWWEYLAMMGEGGGKEAAESPSVRDPVDDASVHLLARRLGQGDDAPAGALRLRATGDEGLWIVDSLASVPEEAGDDLETLLLRTAVLEAARRGAASVRADAPVLRRSLYETLGFTVIETRTGRGDAGTVTMQVSATGMPGPRTFHARFEREGRLCACIQGGCPTRDYAESRRGYFCPLDIREGRLPEGFPRADES